MPKQFIIDKKIVFEPENFRLIAKNNKEIILSHKESHLLLHLCESSMTVISRADLIKKIWGGSESSDIGLNKTILLLRRRFESLGVLNSINTISRVGYMLRLEVEFCLDAPSPDYDTSDTTSVEQQSGGEKKQAPICYKPRTSFFSHWRHFSWGKHISMFFFIAGLVAYISYYYSVKYHEHTFRNMGYKKITNGSLFYTKDVKDPSSLENAVTVLQKNYYMMISKNAISYIEISNNKPKWQKLFFVDEKLPLVGQVQCVAKNINNGAMDLFHVTDKVAGMDYISSYIYEPCISKSGSKGLGEVFIRYTQFPEKSGLMVQEISFKSMEEKIIFKLKKVSEYHANFSRETYAEYNKNKKVKHAKTKSIMLDEINQVLIQSNPLYARVLEELIQKDRYIITINKASNINADSTFGGMLFFDKFYH
ncbi:winged helix-turn-helix domain-containing protein [Aeromonas salmonicida]|uniref:winged helix-turn-helix domain-containing protein n=1 Tax=Aeromonas salmonicida TaxID=645 RepID=UPI00286257A3|nr:winged helix-turn-helix domain-containing protein [Aeromonas salmonicida]MDR7022472.1 DNA-binding winged helix-turn-helix (wHTH) protein [Aeromonas salmonicida]